MLNVKKMLTKIAEKFKTPVSGPETVTFPFTATKSGICIAVVTPPNNALSYVYVTEDGSAHCRGYTTGSAQYTFTFPVIKGKTYAISGAANYNFNNGVRLYPIMGGVVKQLLSALTLGRGWACA